MDRREFLRSMFGVSALVVAPAPVKYFLAPVGGWRVLPQYSFKDVNGILRPSDYYRMLGETDTEFRTRMLRADDWLGVIPVEALRAIRLSRNSRWFLEDRHA